MRNAQLSSLPAGHTTSDAGLDLAATAATTCMPWTAQPCAQGWQGAQAYEQQPYQQPGAPPPAPPAPMPPTPPPPPPPPPTSYGGSYGQARPALRSPPRCSPRLGAAVLPGAAAGAAEAGVTQCPAGSTPHRPSRRAHAGLSPAAQPGHADHGHPAPWTEAPALTQHTDTRLLGQLCRPAGRGGLQPVGRCSAGTAAMPAAARYSCCARQGAVHLAADRHAERAAGSAHTSGPPVQMGHGRAPSWAQQPAARQASDAKVPAVQAAYPSVAPPPPPPAGSHWGLSGCVPGHRCCSSGLCGQLARLCATSAPLAPSCRDSAQCAPHLRVYRPGLTACCRRASSSGPPSPGHPSSSYGQQAPRQGQGAYAPPPGGRGYPPPAPGGQGGQGRGPAQLGSRTEVVHVEKVLPLGGWPRAQPQQARPAAGDAGGARCS